MSLFGVRFKLLFAVLVGGSYCGVCGLKESLRVVEGLGNRKVITVKKKDRSIARVESGSNARLTHNRLIPDRSAAAT